MDTTVIEHEGAIDKKPSFVVGANIERGTGAVNETHVRATCKKWSSRTTLFLPWVAIMSTLGMTCRIIIIKMKCATIVIKITLIVIEFVSCAIEPITKMVVITETLWSIARECTIHDGRAMF